MILFIRIVLIIIIILCVWVTIDFFRDPDMKEFRLLGAFLALFAIVSVILSFAIIY